MASGGNCLHTEEKLWHYACMKYAIGIFGVVIVAVLVFILIPDETTTPDRSNEQEQTQEQTEDNRETRSEPGATTTAAIANGYALSFVMPDGATLSREAGRYYKVLYAGPENEDPALTNGYTVTMTLFEKMPNISLGKFVEDVRQDTANAEDAEIREADVAGRGGYVFAHETGLGNTVTEHFTLVDTETVLQISTSVVGTDIASYEADIEELLGTLEFPQVEETNDQIAEDDPRQIVVSNITPNAMVGSPLVVEGQARGPWYFKATFPVVLVDWDGLIIAEGNAQADGDWMTEDFVPFTAELNFDSPYAEGDPDYMQNGTLILQKANPSGMPERDDALEIPVQFAPTE